MLTKLSKAAGILSPDGSVQINPTTGGVTLYTPPAAASDRIDIRPLGNNRYRVPALSLFIPPSSDYDFPEQVVILPDDRLLCFRIAYQAAVLADIVVDSVTIEAITVTQLELATTAQPTDGDFVSGLIYIPLAMRQGGFVVFPRQTNIGLTGFVKFSMG
jgi:hypothetical protein